jgi:hypothetical protein
MTKAADKMDSFLGISPDDKKKMGEFDDQLKADQTEHYKMQLRIWFKQYKSHLRARIIEMVDPRDWKLFGVKASEDGKTALEGFDFKLFQKDPEKYEALYKEKTSRYVDPKFGGNRIMWDLKLQHDKNLTKHRAKHAKLMADTRRLNIALTTDDLE